MLHGVRLERFIRGILGERISSFCGNHGQIQAASNVLTESFSAHSSKQKQEKM